MTCHPRVVLRNSIRLSLSLVLISTLGYTPRGNAASSGSPDPTRDFITTCTYGALAGGLVGAATLAFSDDPGNRINNVARGASLGLYAGIILGLYMMNGGPSSGDDDAEARAAAGITMFESPESSSSANQVTKANQAKIIATTRKNVAEMKESMNFALLPLVSTRGFEGASAQVILLAF